MMGDLGLTYSRYPRPQPGSFFAPLGSQAVGSGPSSGARQEEKAANKAPPPPKNQEVVEQLGDIALRLNSRQLVSERQVSFRVELSGKKPHLVMVDEDSALEMSRFEANEILELERSMHDMAGFRMSFVT